PGGRGGGGAADATRFAAGGDRDARAPDHAARDRADGAGQGEGQGLARALAADRARAGGLARAGGGAAQPLAEREGRDPESARGEDEAGRPAGRGAAGGAAGELQPRGRDPLRSAGAAGARAGGGQPEAGREPGSAAAAARGSGRAGDRRDRVEVDRHTGGADDGRGEGEAGAHGGAAAPAGGGARGGGDLGGGCHPALAGRAGRPAAADRELLVPGTDRGGQDGAGAGAGGVPVRRRARDAAAGHERVHGEACGGAADRRATGVRGLRRGRAADRARAAAPVRGALARRDRKGAPGCVQHPFAGARRRAVDGRQGADGGFPQHGGDHDLEPGEPASAGRGDGGGAGAGDDRAARAFPAGVPEPGGRDRDLPRPGEGATGADRRDATGAPAGAAGGARHRADAGAGGAGLDPAAGVRPAVRRAAAEAGAATLGAESVGERHPERRGAGRADGGGGGGAGRGSAAVRAGAGSGESRKELAVQVFKTTLLMTVLTLVLMLIGGWIGGDAGLVIALVLAGVMNFVSYFYSDKIALKTYNAQPVARQELPNVYRILESLTGRENLPMPQVYLIP